MIPAQCVNELFDGLAKMACKITGQEYKPCTVIVYDGDEIDPKIWKWNIDQVLAIFDKAANKKGTIAIDTLVHFASADSKEFSETIARTITEGGSIVRIGMDNGKHWMMARMPSSWSLTNEEGKDG